MKELVKEIKQSLQNQSLITAVTTFETVPKEPFKKFRKLLAYEKVLECDVGHQEQLASIICEWFLIYSYFIFRRLCCFCLEVHPK